MARKYDGIREHRLDTDTYTDLGGTGCGMRDGFSKKCIKEADRSFSQSLQCQEINSISALLSLEDSVFIVHSPQGCIGCANMAAESYIVGQIHRGVRIPKNPRIIITNLDQDDVIMGGEKKLTEAIQKAAERYNPKIIFIFTSCASGIIGDDVDAIAAEEQKNTDSILVPVHCDGFRSKICASGYDAAFMALAKYVIPREKPAKEEGLINLFAPTTVSFADQREIERMLGLLGLTVNYIPFYSSLEKLQKIPSAIGSTSICKVFGDEFMKDLSHDFDIPFAHTVMPIGVRNTDKWFRGVAELVGKGALAEEYIAKEHARVLPQLENLKPHLEGKRVFICGGTGRSFAAAALIDDFGMKLVGLETPTYDSDAQLDVEYLNTIHNDYVVDVANMQPFEQVNLVNTLKPDIFIGVPTWSARFGVPTTHVLDSKRPTMGYNGILYLGDKIVHQVENPGFNKKLAKYSRLPYKESWYQSDAFKYIKEIGE